MDSIIHSCATRKEASLTIAGRLREGAVTVLEFRRPALGQPARRAGLAILERVGCAACHEIPGIEWPQGLAGPSLKGFGASPMIGGRFPNQPEVLTAWLIDAPSLAPETGMPPMPLSEAEAPDIAAYH